MADRRASEEPADQARALLALLWRRELPPRPSGRGPKQTVSVDEVVQTAITLADRDGLAKLSVRAVAGELGLRPMSLYTYVPSMRALTALMVDAVAAADAPLPTDAPPRTRMAAIARQVRAEVIAHPWLLEVSPWRVVLGPGRMRRYERQLAALDGIGLTDVEMDRAIAVLTEFATGNARMAVAAAREAAEMSDASWWEVHGPLLTQVMSAQAFPLASRVGAAVGDLYQAPADPDGAFEFGLAAMLDGILGTARSVKGD
ncbi:TetR/AcrR family transcriptional regulator [Nocardia cyriacigeorgica]|uniref:TetR/AcrR family transcriptional regulator n=1 Tax=Nocardia cyriacigeorgica TaxID=135487 RepID=A0A6P1D2J0_9NOCA|nr:TetR/AcrR family transcriptional regulator C-terminal domain-containing protein [Nocardia cyriacigeorgica]NEW39428.1 TetR/AcrR family transcriptional regulator [Nocardia cyriacigeorgica]NEW43719.1 TetR/AcrR family transcriptional regulator [Nocardia cyriacigeorgica]NEW49935.1 TetR/AcrR family transcriptional regulator [Nocardia cyriacigeorgica]NEW54670.1 TetR/AcrR family transcriptional regulator [Nocardia cyriacigeorgica]